MKTKVILSKRFGNNEVRTLDSEFELIISEDNEESLVQTIRKNRDARVLIPFLSDAVNREMIDIFNDLVIIANYAVGYNNIDFSYAGKKGIYVTNTPDILTDATADLTLALILGVSRRLLESDQYMRSGKFGGWGANLLLGKELKGMKLGIIGLGKIGLAAAIRASAFGMEILYYSRSRKMEIEKMYGFKYTDMDRLISESDVISPHIPYSKEVHHLFNKNTFSAMKKGAIFINVSRGGIMDESALADALDNGHLYGAGLDVFEHEPLVEPRLTGMINVIMTPHTGSATVAARSGMGRMVIHNIHQALEGEVPPNLIPELKDVIKS